MKAVLVLVVVALLLAAAASARVGSTREESPLDYHLADRLGLFFRAADKNHDKAISMEDVRAAPEQMELHMPGVTEDEFASFLEVADTDSDGKLTRDELFHGVANGLQSAGFVELEAKARAGVEDREGAGDKRFFGGIIKNVKRKVSGFFNKLLGRVNKGEDGCVICQYVVERCETNVKASGVIPAMNAVNPEGVYLEMEAKDMETGEDATNTVLLETGAQYSVEEVAGASLIGTTRQSTRYQRQLERQKYNEIYRVVDITLDDVCEQAMPNIFYGHCKSVYAKQSDVVDGLRYQYRPTDICFRIGMCGPNSYITRGIHSRYREMKQR